MRRMFVLTLTGADRVGIVDEVTATLLGRGGNVETSRMARLGGEFAILMLASIPEDQLNGLEEELGGLAARGYKVTTTPTEPPGAGVPGGWQPYRIEVQGADHEGIVQGVARHLARHGISFEAMDAETIPAPMSGAPLFSMTARVVVPPGLDEGLWRGGLDEIGSAMNLEIRVVASEPRG